MLDNQHFPVNPMDYILALDQGTTSTRAILFDETATPVAIAQKALTQSFPQPGWVEHDPREIVRDAIQVLREVVRSADIDPSAIRALGITNQRETTVLWEKGSGNPVYPAIVWQSRQSQDVCERIKAKGAAALVAQRSGLVIDPYFSASKIAWLLEQQPDIRKKAEVGEVRFGTIDSWLIWNLSAERRHITDPSNASRTLLLNLDPGTWDPQLCELFDIPAEILPTLVDSSGVCATLDPSILGVAIPIAGIAGDQQAALFGQGCFNRGETKNTYGTGCFLLMNSGDTSLPAADGILSTIAWRIGGRLSYALEGSVFVAGAAVQWLRDSLGILDTAAESEALAKSLASNEGVYLVPAFVGLGAPYWDSEARGTIVGMTRGTGRAHLARAALESIAFQSRELVDLMKSHAGVEIPTLKVDGGATQNQFLMQFQADLLQVPVQVASVQETTARGAAFLAGLGIGMWTESSLGNLVAHAPSFLPRLARDEAEGLLRTWKDAVQAARAFKPLATLR